MRILSSLAIVAFLLVLALPASAQNVIVRVLDAQNNSGETGLVSITPNAAGNGITVNVSVVGEPANGNQPMHIHTGQCGPTLGPVYKPLQNVVDGHSVSNVAGVSIDDLMRGTYAINVHRGPGPLAAAPYVSCTNIHNAAGRT